MTLIVASAEARLGGGRWGKSSNYGCCQSSGSLGVIIGHEKRSRGAHREEKVERKS